MPATFRDPVRQINQEFLVQLEMVSNKIYPLPGGSGRRLINEIDARLSTLKGQTPVGDVVSYYEHVATVRHKPTGKFFVAFRETMDAFLARQTDMTKYPEWLMKAPEKQQERNIHIYQVARHPSQVAVMRSHEDWLSPLAQDAAGDSIFDSLTYFLSKQGVISDEMFKTVKG